MAEEFLTANQPETRDAFAAALKGVPTLYEPHVVFKKRVPHAIGLIRTSDTVSYANLISSRPDRKSTRRALDPEAGATNSGGHGSSFRNRARRGECF